jgi:hypothetical protein
MKGQEDQPTKELARQRKGRASDTGRIEAAKLRL